MDVDRFAWNSDAIIVIHTFPTTFPCPFDWKPLRYRVRTTASKSELQQQKLLLHWLMLTRIEEEKRKN